MSIFVIYSTRLITILQEGSLERKHLVLYDPVYPKMAIRMAEGQTVEKVIRRSGYSITRLARKLGISRNTLYNRFEHADLEYRFIVEVGNVIHYDFITDFPEMKEELEVINDLSLRAFDRETIELWKAEGKYISLLERYTKLLSMLAKLANENTLTTLKKEILDFIEQEEKLYVEILYLVIDYADTFPLQQLLHGSLSTKVLFTGQHALSVNYPMSWYRGIYLMKRPTYHTRTAFKAYIVCDSPIGRYTTWRDQLRNLDYFGRRTRNALQTKFILLRSKVHPSSIKYLRNLPLLTAFLAQAKPIEDQSFLKASNQTLGLFHIFKPQIDHCDRNENHEDAYVRGQVELLMQEQTSRYRTKNRL
eukprot:gene3020-3772_t